MKKALQIVGISVSAIVIALLVAAGFLYVSTAGEYVVLETVADNDALPTLTLDTYMYHSETFGDPESPVVIVLHGGPGGDYRSLLSLKALSDEYFVVFYDQRGSGLSERVSSEELSYQGALTDLGAVIDHFSPGEPVHLIGHSWGGMLASGYLGHEPEKVAKTVMAEPGFLNADEANEWQQRYGEIMSGWENLVLMLRAGFASFHVNGPDPYAREDFLVGQQILPVFMNHPDNAYHCPNEPYDAPMWRWGTSANSAIQQGSSEAVLNSLSEHAADYEKPVLFLAGECNTWIGPELQAKHADFYPNSELAVISESGHDMFWDKPDESLAVIRTFLGE